LESFGVALAIRERLARENPSVTEFHRNLAASHNDIGLLQSETGDTDQALESYGKALAIQERLARENPSVTDFQSDLATSHNNIGVFQSDTGRPDQALTSYGDALAIRERLAREHPESPDNASNLGATLNNMASIDVDAKRFEQARDRLRRAISWQKKALAANTRHPTYRQFLRNHLTILVIAAKGLGNDDEARAAQRELDELAANDPANTALDQRLAAAMRGETTKDNGERLQLAYRAYEKKLYAASTRLFGDALDADPKLADDRRVQHRYNAACAAALAASTNTTPPLPSAIKGEGKTGASAVQGVKRGEIETSSAPRACGDPPRPIQDVGGEGSVREDRSGAAAPPLTDAERAKLRNQARTWLEAELATRTKLLASADAQQRRAIAETLNYWQQDADFSGVRDEAALAELPRDEREAWKSLWARVEAILAKARTP
jgi:tetratricopeptide (TPR) repeat protein